MALLALLGVAACNDPLATDSPYTVIPLTTAPLAGTAGRALPETLVVEVRDAAGHLVPGAKVTWSLPQGGSLAVQLADAGDRMTGMAGDDGRNYAVWTLGLPEGEQEARAVAGLTGEPVAFTATATALHVLDVTVGDDHACAILTDHRPVCWGYNQYGQLGVGDQDFRDAPTLVVGLPTALQIVASPSYHTCARDGVGDVWCWGLGAASQTGSLAAPQQTTPVRVPGAAGATTVEVGYQFTCAILSVGGAWCWGSNAEGRLGIGAPSVGGTTNPFPQIVVGGSDFTDLGLTGDRACALDSTMEVWCWGFGAGGELSPAPSTIYYAPIQPIPGYKFYQVALNWYTNCGVAMGGVVLCWGNNYGLGHDSPPWDTPAPISPRVDGSFAQVSGSSDVFYGRTRDGRVVLWGPYVGYRLSSRNEVALPVRAVDVSGGAFGYCIIAESGALYCDRDNYGNSGLQAFPAP